MNSNPIRDTILVATAIVVALCQILQTRRGEFSEHAQPIEQSPALEHSGPAYNYTPGVSYDYSDYDEYEGIAIYKVAQKVPKELVGQDGYIVESSGHLSFFPYNGKSDEFKVLPTPAYIYAVYRDGKEVSQIAIPTETK